MVKKYFDPKTSAKEITEEIRKLIKPSQAIKGYTKEEFERRRKKYIWEKGDLKLIKRGSGPKLFP
jgi:hypothetical protein